MKLENKRLIQQSLLLLFMWLGIFKLFFIPFNLHIWSILILIILHSFLQIINSLNSNRKFIIITFLVIISFILNPFLLQGQEIITYEILGVNNYTITTLIFIFIGIAIAIYDEDYINPVKNRFDILMLGVTIPAFILSIWFLVTILTSNSMAIIALPAALVAIIVCSIVLVINIKSVVKAKRRNNVYFR